MQSPLRTAAAGLVGNVLEWFDYAVYGFFASEIAKAFFPTWLATEQKWLFTWGIFWAAFVARLIGGVVLGMVGDRIGRRALLTLSIGVMGGATLAIGFLPTYKSIGIAARGHDFRSRGAIRGLHGAIAIVIARAVLY